MLRYCLVFIALLSIVGPLPAMDIYVDSTLDEIDATPGDGDCLSTPSGLCTLRAAVMEANHLSGTDVIILPAGVFTFSLTGIDEDEAASGDLDLRESVAIYGAAMDKTIIDANQTDRVFEVIFGNAYLDSLTIRNGLAQTVSSNVGGGILHRGSLLTLLTVRVSGNTANSGGGIYAVNGATMSIVMSSFENNSTVNAGYTNAWGAAMFVQGELDLSFSTVTGSSNQTGNGAAVYLTNCSTTDPDIFNSTIAGNNAGGVYAYNCNLSLRSTTIAANAGTGLSYGVYTGLVRNLTAINTIIADSSSGDCFLTSASVSFTSCLASDSSCGLSSANGNLPATDALLLPLRGWGNVTDTMYPDPELSPVIDAGAGGGDCPSADQRNVQRPVDGDGNGTATCDIGAVEAGDLVSWAGFESGTTGEWDAVVSP